MSGLLDKAKAAKESEEAPKEARVPEGRAGDGGRPRGGLRGYVDCSFDDVHSMMFIR